MIFRLKTSKRTQEIFQELENRTNYKPYTLVKHAIAWSIRESKKHIVELFEKMNLLEKRSDSGDAQYVKYIL